MNQSDKEKMIQIIKNELEECFDAYLKCDVWINEIDEIRISVNFLDTDKDSYSEDQMENYKEIIQNYLQKSEFSDLKFDIEYDFGGNLTLSYIGQS